MDEFETLLAPPRQSSRATPRSEFIVPPAVQAGREDERVRILREELGRTTDPGDRAAISRELARAGVSQPAQAPQGTPQTAQPQQAKGPDAFEDFLTRPPTASTPKLSASAPALKATEPPGLVKRTLDSVGRMPVPGMAMDWQTLASQASGIGATVAGGISGLLSLGATGDASKAADRVRDTTEALTYEPPKGSVAEAVGQAAQSKYNPLMWPGMVSEVAGEKVADVTGSPALGAAVNAAGNFVIPGVIGKGIKAVPLRNLAGKEPLPISKRIEPTMDAQAPGAVPAISGPEVNPTQLPAVTGQGKVPVRAEPIRSIPEQGIFAEAAPVAEGGKALPPSEQARRAQVLRDVGVENARQSAIAGDPKAAGTDLQTSKLDGPAGNFMRSQLDAERAALTNYAEGITRDTGGTMGVSQDSAYARGGTITKVLDSFKGYFDKRTSDLYKVADEKAQGVPTELNTFRKVLGDDSEMTNADRVHLRSAVQSFAKQLNIIGEDGKVFSNGQQAETLRKYLGDNWSPANGKWVGKLKDALDKDILSSAGEDVYKPARELWKLKKNTLDNPNGIAKIMDASGPEGINRAVPIEKIADTLSSMPVDQFGHVVRTLRSVPEHLAPQAEAAISELKAHYASKIESIGNNQAGQWNAKGVRNYLRDQSSRMRLLFSPEELQKFGTLNDAGNILVKPADYPGASVQQHNLLRAGVMGTIQAGTSALGSVAGPGGAALGSYVGGKLASKFGDASSLKSAQGRVVRVSDLLNQGGLK